MTPVRLCRAERGMILFLSVNGLVVAQIFNLLYRRIVFRLAWDSPGGGCPVCGPADYKSVPRRREQIENLRYIIVGLQGFKALIRSFKCIHRHNLIS